MKHVATKNQRDRLVIETLIRRFGQLSRVDIHELTHLQRSEISRLVRELLDAGRLVQAGRADNPTGRKQVLLRLNEEHGFVLALGFDDESLIAALLDLRPQVRAMVRESTCLTEGVEGLTKQLFGCARRVIHEAGVPSKSLLGIGVAASGLINSSVGTMVMSSTLDFCKNVPLQRIFEEEFGVSTWVENLTRAKTVAERTLGAGAMAEDMIYIEYGRTGIGAGILIDGALVHGSGYAAGEFGHTHMIEEGPACKCGSFGCLEAIAGAAALETRIRRAVAEGSTSLALARANGNPEKISGWTVLEAARQGDKTCTAIVEQLGNYLGLGLANLVNLFNPSILVLDQRLELAGEGLLDQIAKVIRRQALTQSTKDLVVRFGRLGADASVLGVGSIVLEKHFEIPALKPLRFMIESVSAPRKAVSTGVA